MAKNVDKIQKALNMTLQDAPVTRICEILGISRRTYYNWANAGELTNGEKWAKYKERIQEEMIREARVHELERAAEQGWGFLEQMKEELKAYAYEAVITKIRAGNFDTSISDLKTIASLYAMLDNQAADKMAFAEWFSLRVTELVFEIMNEQQFALFKTRLLLLQKETEAKLLPLGSTGQPETVGAKRSLPERKPMDMMPPAKEEVEVIRFDLNGEE